MLAHLGLAEHDRVKPRVVSDQVIRAVEPYHAQVINKMRYGDQLLAGESLFILETEPAGYIAFAANEALKAARIKLIDASLFGAYGRLYLSGRRGADRRRARRRAELPAHAGRARGRREVAPPEPGMRKRPPRAFPRGPPRVRSGSAPRLRPPSPGSPASARPGSHVGAWCVVQPSSRPRMRM